MYVLVTGGKKMKNTGRIVIDPKIQHGKPIVRGTRVPVARVIAELAGGMTREELMREYDISAEDVAAALAYAADLVEADEFHPLPAG
jgi:uncharacterized protein (DUF433 family)